MRIDGSRHVFWGDVAFAVGVPVLGVALMAGGMLLVAYGPASLAHGFVGGAITFILIACAMALIVFTSGRYEHVLVYFGSVFALFGAMVTASLAVEGRAFQDRGRTTTCTVLDVRERVETTIDSNNDTQVTTYYDHVLRCDQPSITGMTTGRPAGKPNDQIEVAYDPAGRLDPRPSTEVGNPDTLLWIAVGLLVVGVGLRVGYVFSVYH
jgi:hypothetical protein